VEELARAKHFVRTGSSLSLEPVAPLRDELWPQIERLMTAQGLRPARAAELARALRSDPARVERALRRAAAERRAFQVAPGHYLLADAIARCAQSLERIEREEGACTLARFRETLDLGRRAAVEILEFFDRAGFTVRCGDAHRVRKPFAEALGEPRQQV
jgi:selenocysteine-specific elongation factor